MNFVNTSSKHLEGRCPNDIAVMRVYSDKRTPEELEMSKNAQWNRLSDEEAQVHGPLAAHGFGYVILRIQI